MRTKTVVLAAWVPIAIAFGFGCEFPDSTGSKTGSATRPSIAERLSAAKAALDKKPDFENHLALGLVLSEAGRHEDALAQFRGAALLKSDSPIAFNDICAELNQLKRWVLAIPECKKALQLAPAMALAKNNLEHAQRSKQREDARLAELRSGLGRAPDSDLARINLGQGLYEQGAYEDAISEWEQVKTQSKRFALAQNNIASALIFLGRYPEARKAIDRALALEPGNPLFKNNERWLANVALKAPR